MIDFDFPYPSQRMPVLARDVVATSQPLAAQAGLRMLLEGGNAVDAAIATAVALTVVEPSGNGIGSDAFALVWDGRQLHGLNASGRAPEALRPEHLVPPADGPVRGWNSVTVPGAVSAWVALSERFGRLPFEKLFEPAIGYARDGFLVTPRIAHLWHLAEGAFRDVPEFVEAFLPSGRAPRAGERFAFPEQAATLERIAATRGHAFYRGELAERIAAHARQANAPLVLSDLEDHEPFWCTPISQAFHGVELHEIPPNGQGIAALMTLGILEHLPLSDHAVDSAQSVHLQIEAMKLAFADVHRFVGDSDAMRISVDDLLDPAYLASRATLIHPERASDPGHGVPRPGGTVYLTAADRDGVMVSYIQSNYYGFGSGIVVPGTGISLQNRAAGFDLDPRHPNVAAGGKRPFHTIIPGFLTRGGRPLASFGVMGGPMQPQGHVQMTVRLALYGQNPQAAIDAPRWQVVRGKEVSVEPSFPVSTLEDLERMGHRLSRATSEQSFAFGGAQIVYRVEDGYVAASDPRKDGQAVGF